MRPLVLVICWLTSMVIAQDKYTDENRPYKFGFNIEGHQHRKEEKDEKGIIKGEYGFITADGYYRVTIYETDENNDFKIISMKNYYVGFPPGDPTTTEAPLLKNSPNRLLLPLARTNQETTTVAPKVQESTTIRQLGKGGTCSGCFLPTTIKKPLEVGIQKSELPRTPSISEPKPNRNSLTLTQDKNNMVVNNKPNSILGEPKSNTYKTNLNPNLNQTVLTTPSQNTSILKTSGKEEKSLPFSNQEKNERNINKLVTPTKSDVNKPVENILLPLKINDENNENKIGDIKPKLSIDEMMALLYRFNYTVGFHGHHEDGYRNGDKSGDYFVNGRDGVSRKVTYIANEFGYQPNITLVQLKEEDDNYPKEKSEKEHGLKGYEFKWFYRK